MAVLFKLFKALHENNKETSVFGNLFIIQASDESRNTPKVALCY